MPKSWAAALVTPGRKQEGEESRGKHCALRLCACSMYFCMFKVACKYVAQKPEKPNRYVLQGNLLQIYLRSNFGGKWYINPAAGQCARNSSRLQIKSYDISWVTIQFCAREAASLTCQTPVDQVRLGKFNYCWKRNLKNWQIVSSKYQIYHLKLCIVDLMVKNLNSEQAFRVISWMLFSFYVLFSRMAFINQSKTERSQALLQRDRTLCRACMNPPAVRATQ